MSILTIAQAGAGRLSLSEMTTLIGNANDQAKQLLRLVTEEARALAMDYTWQALTREQTFATVASEEQTGAIPDDFLRIINGTMYNRTKTWSVAGPMTAEQWQSHKATLVTQIFDAFRIRGGSILIAPTPPNGQTIAFEYVTRNIGTDAARTTARSEWVADSDIPYLDEELVTLGVIWRWLNAKGLDYAEQFRLYETRRNLLLQADGGAARVSMDAASTRVRRPTAPIIPDTLVGLT